MRILILFTFVLGLSCSGCKPHIGPTIDTIIDCLAEDQTKLEALAVQLLPLLAGDSPDWGKFETEAIRAGANIGGCVAADLLQRYLAPPPGNTAPTPENGRAARETQERIRAQFNGVKFKTTHGTI